jgi:hypothetical protein
MENGKQIKAKTIIFMSIKLKKMEDLKKWQPWKTAMEGVKKEKKKN